MEQQAFARVHRIGQERRVHTVKLIVENSVDERVQAIQNRKEANIAQVQEGNLNKTFGTKELSSLMVRGKTTQDIASSLGYEDLDIDGVGISDGDDKEVGDSDSEYESGSSDEGSENSDTEQEEDLDLFD